ncbi:MAG TPA: hypothetical protein VF974_04460 [Patescibacteria group bacterium]
MKNKNTIQKGSVRYIVFKEDSTWYAVGLEFNIIESGDDPKEVLLFLFEAMKGYVKSARKIKSRPQILNQKSDEEYERLWNKLIENSKNGKESSIKTPVYTFGRTLAFV